MDEGDAKLVLQVQIDHIQYFFQMQVDSNHIIQGYFISTEAIMWLLQC